MSKKKTHQEYVEELSIKNPTVKAIEQYAGAKNLILHYCITHNIQWKTTPERVLKGCGCPECKKEQLHKNKTKSNEQYIKEVESLNPDILVIGEYINARTPIEHYCKKHHIYWNAYPESILRGGGCCECCKEKIGDRLRKTHEQYVSDVLKNNPNIEVKGIYVDANTPILHKCKEHNILWMAYPNNILRGHGCYICGNNLKKTNKQYVNEVNTINKYIDVIGTYIDAKTPITHRCKIDNYTWDASPDSILRGTGCPKCARNAKKTTDSYVKELSLINQNIEAIEDYSGANTKILHRCKVDGFEWEATPANVLFGCGCPECKKRILHNIFVKSHTTYVQQLFVINPDLEVIGEYVNSKTPILHKCKIDGYEWFIAPMNTLSGQGCPQCQESIGERRIRQYLQMHNIAYSYQHKFEDCKDKKQLPFDFYLPDYNLCIEYDGRQHFEPVNFSGNGYDWSLSQFATVQKHDNMKSQYCKDNNIHLLRIPYFKNVESELETFLFI